MLVIIVSTNMLPIALHRAQTRQNLRKLQLAWLPPIRLKPHVTEIPSIDAI
jgi:hypothetical protein